MNFFDLLGSLFFFKKSASHEELDHDSLQSFTPYMVNRWLSFVDKSKAKFVNETFNKFTNIFDDKSDSYKFYYYLTPRSKFTKINYIKKTKEDKEKSDTTDCVNLIASNGEISQREVKQYMELFATRSK
jgi:hypothetical protein